MLRNPWLDSIRFYTQHLFNTWWPITSLISLSCILTFEKHFIQCHEKHTRTINRIVEKKNQLFWKISPASTPFTNTEKIPSLSNPWFFQRKFSKNWKMKRKYSRSILQSISSCLKHEVYRKIIAHFVYMFQNL